MSNSIQDFDDRGLNTGTRPSTAPVGLLSSQQWEGGKDELIAVPITGADSSSTLMLPRSSFPPQQRINKLGLPNIQSAGASLTDKEAPLPAVARPPLEHKSHQRLLDECVPPSSVPRSPGAFSFAAMPFNEIHKLYHDLIMSLFYGEDDGDNEIPVYIQKERRLQRHTRRNNTRYTYLLENIIPSVSQGLIELSHATIHRQKQLRKILPQCFVEDGTSEYSETLYSNITDDNFEDGLSQETLLQPPGGAIVWLARYLIRNNPTRIRQSSAVDTIDSGSKINIKDLHISMAQRQFAAVLARCLREYDHWQLCKAQHNALRQVNLKRIWDLIDTNEDGTLDIGEVGKALAQLGFKLRDENEDLGTASRGENYDEEKGADEDAWTLELGELEQLFSALDVDGSGDIDFDEFSLGISKWFSVREKMSRAMFDRKVDSSTKSKDIDMEELLHSLARQRMIRSIQAARLDSASLFEKIDKDNDGYVDYDDFLKGITELANVVNSASPERLVDSSGNAQHLLIVLSRNSRKLFQDIDTNGDGLISLEEFKTFFIKYIDEGIEQKAWEAGKRIEQEQTEKIKSLLKQGNKILNSASQTLTKQRLRLDKLQGFQRDTGNISAGGSKYSILELKELVSQLKIVSSPDFSDEHTISTMHEAQTFLKAYTNAVQNAENACNLARSDINSAFAAIISSTKQANPTIQLADLQHTVGSLSTISRGSRKALLRTSSNIEHFENGNISIVDAAEKSIYNLIFAVDEVEAIISEALPIGIRLNNALAGAKLYQKQLTERRAIEKKRKKRLQNERRDAEEAVRRHRIQAAEKAQYRRAEAKRLEELAKMKEENEFARQKSEEENAKINAALIREREAAERDYALRLQAAEIAKERQKMKLEMQRAQFAEQRRQEEAKLQEKHREEEAVREAQKIIENFLPDSSVFKTRGKGLHAAFFDTDKICRETVELELERALSKPSVESLINHPNQEQIRDVKRAFIGSDIYSGAVSRAILNVYRHYCLSGHHIFSMQKYGFDTFTQESKIVDPASQTCTMHHLETTFITSNLNSPQSNHRSMLCGRHHQRPHRSLNRAEFIEALIRIGIQKYYADDTHKDKVGTTGEAVKMVIRNHILPLSKNQDTSRLLVNKPLVDPNELREAALYSHAVDKILRKPGTLQFLRNTFQGLCGDNESGRIQLKEWLDFVNHLSKLFKDMTGSSLFSEINAKECYLYSQLIIVDEEKPTAAQSVHTLNFEDFLEAIVRLTNGIKTDDTSFEAQEESSNDPDIVACRLDLFLTKFMGSENYKHLLNN